ncbi:MAG: SUMF1/EgtB/PvdO family nonheme iron enzyme [Candidatus Hydrogenedentes bacterium]|nr:SUMF1/EgtB/PvdO family nonheme iron enzyme [Candidatus Hydrogenedentota bacterium]
MAILISCPSCSKQFRVTDQAVGRTCACPQCHATITALGDRVPDYDVFVSYSNKDKHVADAVCAALENRRIRCWIAPRDVPGGAQWGSTIIDAISECQVMVLVFSAHSNRSSQVLREVGTAVENSTMIIPFRIDECPMSKDMQYLLKPLHWLDAMTPPLEDHLRKLVSRVLSVVSEHQEVPQLVMPMDSPAAPRPVEATATNKPGVPKKFLWGGIAILATIAVLLTFLWPPVPAEDVAKHSTEAVTAIAPATAPEPGEGRAFNLSDAVSMDFIWIPPGTFTMGSPESEPNRLENETPHEVVLTQGFWFGKYEVTQWQWEAIMSSNPSRKIGPDQPVEQINWFDCQEFIDKINAERQGIFRFPTEAEWEYASRAGTNTAYFFGENSADLGAYAWYESNNRGSRHPVGRKLPNPWGLHDIYGNVWEWCADVYADYPSGSVTNPVGLATGGSRVSRGGSWFVGGEFCRSAKREGTPEDNRHISRGLRLVRAR